MNYDDEKIFANCPRAYDDCRFCPNKGKCIIKRRQINERRAQKRKMIVRRRIASVVILGSLLCGVCMSSFAKNDDASRAAREVTKVSVSENQEEKISEINGQLTAGVSSDILEIAFTEKTLESTSIDQTQESENESQTEIVEEQETVSNTEEVKDYTPIASGPRAYYVYIFSDEDKVYMAKLAYQEARGEKLEGIVAVIACVINRFYSNDPVFDTESIYSVITQKNSFADISPVTQEMLDEAPQCMEAVELACKGWDPTRAYFEEGAKFFYAPNEPMSDYQRSIRQGVPTYSIGNHNFHNEFND